MYPILFDFGPLTVHSLWFFITIAFVVASFDLSKFVKRARLRIDFILDHSMLMLIAVIACSRLFFVLGNFDVFFGLDRPIFQTVFALFAFWDKGLSFWGAALGLLGSTAYFAHRSGQSIKKWLDVMSISLLTGMAIASIGTFLDGIAHGRETILPWGVAFQSAVVKYAVPIHPTQLYAFLYLTGLVIFNRLFSHRFLNRDEGCIFELNVMLYSFLRFLEEFFRGDDTIMLGFVRLPQLVAFLVFLFMAWRFWTKRRELVDVVLVKMLLLKKIPKTKGLESPTG